jgi:hypothetical protein
MARSIKELYTAINKNYMATGYLDFFFLLLGSIWVLLKDLYSLELKEKETRKDNSFSQLTVRYPYSGLLYFSSSYLLNIFCTFLKNVYLFCIAVISKFLYRKSNPLAHIHITLPRPFNVIRRMGRLPSTPR